jgi:hypothetical protein
MKVEVHVRVHAGTGYNDPMLAGCKLEREGVPSVEDAKALVDELVSGASEAVQAQLDGVIVKERVEAEANPGG